MEMSKTQKIVISNLSTFSKIAGKLFTLHSENNEFVCIVGDTCKLCDYI